MAKTDKTGKSYLKLSDAFHGQHVSLDGGFSCCHAGTNVIYFDREDRPFFYCGEGKHYLDGQDDGDGYCVGVYV